MDTTGDKTKKSERLGAFFDFIFGFENKRGEVLDQWLYSADGFSYPPQDFYAAVEKQLEARKIPSLETTRQDFAEGGLLSEQRSYLRFMRERLAIVTCAAPFGTIYFFSCRVVYVPALVRLWHIVAAGLFFFVVTRLLIEPLGLSFAAIAIVGLAFAVAAVMRNAGSSAIADLDALLLRIPILSTIYQDWFRIDTYYREDSRALYAKLLPAIIREAAEEICAEKGCKLVRQFQNPAILEELYRATPPQKPME
jgi:hypothetical protein